MRNLAIIQNRNRNECWIYFSARLLSLNDNHPFFYGPRFFFRRTCHTFECRLPLSRLRRRETIKIQDGAASNKQGRITALTNLRASRANNCTTVCFHSTSIDLADFIAWHALYGLLLGENYDFESNHRLNSVHF